MISERRTQYLKEFDFDNWANTRYLHFIEENDIRDEKVNLILGHILSAQVLWIKRVRPIGISDYQLWKNYNVNEMKEMSNAAFALWKDFILKFPDEEFSDVISYTNTQGLSFETPLHEIIRHVLHHGTYHRGQLAFTIRGLGLTPPYTDYIAFVRGQ